MEMKAGHKWKSLWWTKYKPHVYIKSHVRNNQELTPQKITATQSNLISLGENCFKINKRIWFEVCIDKKGSIAQLLIKKEPISSYQN